MQRLSQPNMTYIDRYINDGEKSIIKLSNLYETMLVTDPDGSRPFRAPLNDFFIKNREALAPTIQYYSLPQSMFYKPKATSLELYGTTELWLALLRLNGMKNITEFHMPLIKVYNAGELLELLQIFFKREKVIR